MLGQWWAQFGHWTLGNFTIPDLLAASTNAFKGVLLARRPDHDKLFTVVGIVLARRPRRHRGWRRA
jgi:hypothetical protein